MRLADWARREGFSYCAAYQMFRKKTLPVRAFKTPSGSILVDEEGLFPKQEEKFLGEDKAALVEELVSELTGIIVEFAERYRGLDGKGEEG